MLCFLLHLSRLNICNPNASTTPSSHHLATCTPRAHRIGQQRVLHVYRLFVPNSIEEKVLAGQREKLEVARAVVNDDNTRYVSLVRLRRGASACFFYSFFSTKNLNLF